MIFMSQKLNGNFKKNCKGVEATPLVIAWVVFSEKNDYLPIYP